MTPFIRVAEVWVPTEDRTQLRLSDGYYGPFDDFRALSEQTRFRPGEGLPGKAWATRHPIILKELAASNFKRAEAAEAIDLTCGVALPIFAGDLLTSVVVMLGGNTRVRAGAIELWHNDSDRFNDLRLIDGFYGAAITFEFNSRHMSFPRGYGLPGRTWKSRLPLIMKDINNSNAFLRSQQVDELGINAGLGIPYSSPPNQTWILVFLVARDTPIARRFEIWIPDKHERALIFHSGDCDQSGQMPEELKSAVIAKGQGTIGRAWQSGIADVCANLAADTSPAGRSASAARLDATLAMPFINDEGVKGIVAWYF